MNVTTDLALVVAKRGLRLYANSGTMASVSRIHAIIPDLPATVAKKDSYDDDCNVEEKLDVCDIIVSYECSHGSHVAHNDPGFTENPRRQRCCSDAERVRTICLGPRVAEVNRADALSAFRLRSFGIPRHPRPRGDGALE
jgi:hypothetical protein